MNHQFVLIHHDMSEEVIGTTTSRNLPRALVLKAEKVFGRGKWYLKTDTSLAGGYAISDDGVCLTLRCFGPSRAGKEKHDA